MVVALAALVVAGSGVAGGSGVATSAQHPTRVVREATGSNNVFAHCHPGETATGGGFRHEHFLSYATINEPYPGGRPTAWWGRASNHHAHITVYAVCEKP
jgi:hypothetical protein